MSDPSFVLLYVKSPTASATFYSELLGKPPVEASPTFVMFALAPGVMLGLWAAHAVRPAASASGGSELAFVVQGDDALEARHASWHEMGMPVIQAPTRMDFGYTFVATDPDGHRLRVFAPGR